MKKTILFSLICGLFLSAFAQNVTTEEFAVKDTNHLLMDIYTPAQVAPENGFPCIVFVFGGGFITGTRNTPNEVKAFQQLTERGFVVVSIDYRLGLKGVEFKGIKIIGAVEHAIDLAVSDLFSATAYICTNAERLHINRNEILISGCSAGAITVLQADYVLHNHPESTFLPEGFRYAGVMSFSGAIFSRQGKIKYTKGNPAPTLMLHGTADKLVNYRQIEIANLGLYGSSKIAPRFEKFGYPYYLRSLKGQGHEVAISYLENVDLMCHFYQQWVKEGKNLQVDEMFYDKNHEPCKWGMMRPSDLYKKQ